MSLFGRDRHTGSGHTCLAALGLAAGLSLMGVAPAHAQSSLPEPGTFDVTPFLGLAFGSDYDASTTSLVLGGAFAYNWTTNLAFEGELGILPDIVGDDDNLDVRVTTVSGNAIYHFDTGMKFVPYATLGLGFGRTNYETNNVESSTTELTVNLGGGVKADIGNHLQVRGDLRYFNINDENPNFWRLYGGVVFRLPR
jgi:opacity protein-like surface antigen